ncbi:unnamed protein product [Cylindrotheca closterium]|uniref:Uncharacterized protein n=1 Tax=Cylindrotheca closterium TaxID=2856 RepID=A0AAD2PW49_9STRA|nr:unnamed protein product [Cylindrotheca closterium]
MQYPQAIEYPPRIQHDEIDEDGVTLEMKETWVLLCRLLYRMKYQEDIPTEATGQSWHALIARAQLAQDMWKSLSHEVASRDFAVYQKMSNKVDSLCRRAHRLAEERRAHAPPDLIDEIFFSNDSNDSDSDSDDSKEGMQEEQHTVKSAYASDESKDEENESNDRRNKMATPTRNDAKNTTPMTNEALQKAQREQMEEAIAQMARHMKEATMGISNTLQQQNQSTLNELETVAEQNAQDMSKVTTDVTDHNRRQWRKNFSTWSMMFLLVGIFVFTMLMIFTLPKHPTGSLLGKRGMIRTSVSWASTKSLRVVQWATDKSGIMNVLEGDELPSSGERVPEDLFEESEAERRQKEKLDQIIASRKARDFHDNFGDDYPDHEAEQGGKPKQKSTKTNKNTNAGSDGYMESKITASGDIENDVKQDEGPADVDMDELIASLNRQAQKALEEQKAAQKKAEEAARKAKEEEEARVRAEEAALLARKERERKERQEAVRIAREEVARKEREEEEARIRAAQEEVKLRAQQEEELRFAREEEEAKLRAKEEAERKARQEREEELRRAREAEEVAEAERLAQMEREEALQKAREEEARKAREAEDARIRAEEERRVQLQREEELRRAWEEEEARAQREAEEAANAQAERFAQMEKERIAREEALRKSKEEEVRKRTEEAANAQADRFAQIEREQMKREEAFQKAREAREQEEARVRAEEAAAAEAERFLQEKQRIEREEALKIARQEAERRAREEERERLEREAAWRQARGEASRQEERAQQNPHKSDEHLEDRLQQIHENTDHNRVEQEKRARMEDAKRHDEDIDMEEYVERGREKLDEYLGREERHDEL